MRYRALLVTLAVSVAAVAAQGRWEAPYKKGTDAFKAKKWQEAITNLEAAVKFDPKEEANKTSEGAFGTDYFPYYYLGVAHLRLGHFDKAEEYLQLAAKDRIQRLQPLIAAAQSELDATKPKPQPANPPANPPPPKPNSTPPPAAANPPSNPVTPPPNAIPPATNPPSTKPAEPAKPALDPKFEPTLRTAQTALDTRRYADAMQRFDELKTIDATEFARRGLASRRTEAARGRALELTQEGLTILRNKDGRLADARAKFQEAQRIQPSVGASDGLAEVSRREAAAATAANEPKPAPPAPAPVPAPPSPPPVVTPAPPAAPDFSVVPLQQALLEYLKGNVPRTIELLEPAARADNGTLDKRVRAPLHAYLGAAYADRSLVARADDEKKKLEQQALAQFKIALDAAPDFQLSETAISPAIRDLFKKATGRRP